MTDDKTMTTLDEAQVDAVASLAGDVVTDAAALVVSDTPGLELASGLLAGIKALRKDVAAVFDAPTRKAHEAHKEIIAARKMVEQPLLDAERKVKAKVGSYHNEQRRLADEARRKEEARLRKLEEERRLAKAVELESKGKAEEAEAELETVAPTPAPIITTPPLPKVAGLQTRTTRKAAVVSLHELVQYAASCPEYLYVLEAVQAHLDALARKHKGIKDGGQLLPGVVVVETTGVASV